MFVEPRDVVLNNRVGFKRRPRADFGLCFTLVRIDEVSKLHQNFQLNKSESERCQVDLLKLTLWHCLRKKVASLQQLVDSIQWTPNVLFFRIIDESSSNCFRVLLIFTVMMIATAWKLMRNLRPANKKVTFSDERLFVSTKFWLITASVDRVFLYWPWNSPSIAYSANQSSIKISALKIHMQTSLRQLVPR